MNLDVSIGCDMFTDMFVPLLSVCSCHLLAFTLANMIDMFCAMPSEGRLQRI
jgi:hypothetical protein